MNAAVIQDQALGYPGFEEFMSPSERFPEYEFGHLSTAQNPVYGAVRACIADTRLDCEHFGQASWNPFGAYIRPGDNVFVLCNFVQEHRGLKRGGNVFAKCTHGSVVRPVIDYALKALQGRGSVTFGNAPIQSCDWSKVVKETGADRVEEFYRRFGGGHARVELTDLRQHVVQKRTFGALKVVSHSEDQDGCVRVSFDADSLLEELQRANDQPRFRVLDYDPRRTQQCHGPEQHTYLVSRRILASNVIISVPKLKTHEKVGITCALKGCVGTVAHKDCLAHHRYGPPSAGGDEYPEKFAALAWISALHDVANTSSSPLARGVSATIDCYSRKIIRRFTRSLSGSWPGNDTCWRMALDLARIVTYADPAGRICRTPQRRHLVITDGIIGGEGNGPLSPEPVKAGYLSVSDNLATADYINCLAMGFEPERIPLIREAFRLHQYRLTDGASMVDCPVCFNGQKTSVGLLKTRLNNRFVPPREWGRCLR